MKSFFALLFALLLIVQAACASCVKPPDKTNPEAEPTEAATAEPTEAATAEPTEVATAEPTYEPTAAPAQAPIVRPVAPPDMGEMPDFPEAVRLGNLIGGELFPEPAKYLVLKGEGDLKYVYDCLGELVTMFNAEEDEYGHWFCDQGFYGENGAPCGYSIERGELLPNYKCFGDMAIEYGVENYYDENGEQTYDCFITDIKDERLEKTILMDSAPEYRFCDSNGENERMVRAFRINLAGGILHVDGKYIVYEAAIVDGGLMQPLTIDYGDCFVYDEDENHIGTLDLSSFGAVRGVFGGKYIVGERRLDESERYEDPVYGMVTSEKNLYTLSGELVMSRIEVFETSYFSADQDFEIGRITTSRFLKDADGNFYDNELKRIDAPEESELYRDPDMYSSGYFPIFFADRHVVSNGVYAGIQDDDGNWLFRIYDPVGASDGRNSEYWPGWYRDIYLREKSGDD